MTQIITSRTPEERAKAVSKAAILLREGAIVALPTETVYGLAADAFNPIAIAKIFEAKERPRFDPLIVHLPDRDWLERVAEIPSADRQLLEKLVDRFWPGPFTIVLPRKSIVPEIVTAGMDTVAVRISAHPIFGEIIRAFGRPLAAPSANRFGRVSPTTAQHVLDELARRIPLIVDAGPTEHGIESTIVALRDGKIDVLRRGPITEEQLRGMGFQPMSPHEKVLVRQGAYLPHWTQIGATYAVTFRLTDSLPKEVLAAWEFERRNILLTARQQKREPTEVERRDLAKLFSEKIERYLDAGHGKCWLQDERIATVMRDALLHFDGKRYELAAWCIMPNHVHVIVRPTPGHTLPQILHSWKSFAAKEANRLLKRRGSFWQPESYDHLIRTEKEFNNQISYILDNPKKAGLKSWPWVSTPAKNGTGFQPVSHRQDADATIRAPGQLPSHYAPKTLLRLIDNINSFSPAEDQRVGLLIWNPVEPKEGFVAIRRLSERGDFREAAANLFRQLRELDQLDLDLIVAEPVPEEGLGAAIMDRLRRASQR